MPGRRTKATSKRLRQSCAARIFIPAEILSLGDRRSSNSRRRMRKNRLGLEKQPLPGPHFLQQPDNSHFPQETTSMKTPVHKARIKNGASNVESRLTHSKNHFGATRQTTSAVRKPVPRKDARPKGKRTDPFRRDAN